MRKIGKEINLNDLRQAIRTMTKDSLLFAVIRDELKKRGNWKNRPRGKPFSTH